MLDLQYIEEAIMVLECGFLAEKISHEPTEVRLLSFEILGHGFYDLFQMDWIQMAYQRAGLLYLHKGLVDDAKNMISKGNLDPRILGYLYDQLRDCLNLSIFQKQFLLENLRVECLEDLSRLRWGQLEKE